MWWLRKEHPRAGRKAQKVCGSKERTTVELRVAAPTVSQTEVVEDFESRPHKAESFLVERNKEIKGWSEEKLSKVLPGYSGGECL